MIQHDEKGRREEVFDVWGRFALFTRAETKIERQSYDVITPSAARGIAMAIYAKPIEFNFMVTKIEVMNPIQTITFKRNDIKRKADARTPEPIYTDRVHTQRHSVVLKDVYYRIHVIMKPQKAFLDAHPELTYKDAENKFYSIFEKRLSRGQCFKQPYFGSKEFMCLFDEPDEDRKPIAESRDLGIILYDMFDIEGTKPIVTGPTKAKTDMGSFSPSFFHGYMINGVVNIPDYHGPEVFKKKEGSDA